MNTLLGTTSTLYSLRQNLDRVAANRHEVARLLASNTSSAPSLQIPIAQLKTLSARMNVRTSLMFRLYADPGFTQRRELRTRTLFEDIGRLATLYDRTSFLVVEHASNFYRANLPLGLYDSGDVDLLSSPKHLDGLRRSLATLGYHPQDNKDGLLRRVFHRPHDIAGPLEIVVWLRPLARNWLPEPRFVTVSDLFERAEWAESRWGRVPLLPATLDLIYHCLHASLHSYILSPGLRIYLDIDRAIADTDVDWDEVVRFSKAHKLAVRIVVALRIAHKLLCTPVPTSVLQELGGQSRSIQAFARLASKLALYPEWSAKCPRLATVLAEGSIALSELTTQDDQN